MQMYIESTGQGRETVQLSEAYAAIPSVKVYAEYCASSVSGLFGNARVIKGTVVDVAFVSGSGGGDDDVKNAMGADGFDSGRFGAMVLTLDDGRRVLAARCVWTGKFSQPLVPEWVRTVDARGRGDERDASKRDRNTSPRNVWVRY